MPNVTIVVDVLNGFCKEGNLASPHCAAAIPRIRSIVEARHAAGDALIFLADTHDPDDREFEVFPVHCVRGTSEAEVVSELTDLLAAGRLIRKRRYSGFFETDLEAQLDALDPKTVTVVGVCTDICVLHTVADLRNRDYHVVVPVEGVETFDAPGHPRESVQAFALAHLKGILGAELISGGL
ncbi:MAG TPA: isochorismatase family cysteine hydrolase [Candidatus Limnocylindrales bacterium]|nr:isochorismatase family cysteine hydrolase [Candidatus Limnocylindrales bacterium]